MQDYIVFGIIFVALAIGFTLGRCSIGNNYSSHRVNYPLKYYKGLSSLYNEHPDAAIDAFIRALEVNEDTLEAHLALGNMLRKRGEVTKAIKIHQNLIAGPSLGQEQLHEAQLELARDYIKSGLLDRSEALLLDLIKETSPYRPPALLHLMEIYQDEHDWDKAIEMAGLLSDKQYKDKHDLQLNVIQAYFACEQALDDIVKHNTDAVRLHLEEALIFDKNSVRASLLFAQFEFEQGNYKKALHHLRNISSQHSDYIVEGLKLLCETYETLDESENLLTYLFELLEKHPSNSLIICIANKLRKYKTETDAENFIAKQLKDKPSIRTLNRLVEFHLPHSEGKAKENLSLLKLLVDKVIAEKPSYCCNKCGFTGNNLHWLCPGCKTWGTVSPIKGVAGE